MKLLKGREMQELDGKAIEELGLPSLLLMENAARSTAQALLKHFPKVKRLLVLAGRGNNGGDGLALVRILRSLGIEAHYYLVFGEVRGDALFQLELLKKLGVEPLKSLPPFENYELVVDAVFGTGFKPPLRGEVAELVEELNRSPVPVLAVDLPSGLSADSGAVEGAAVRAELTVTFQFPKLCHVLFPASLYCGKVEVADISIPPSLAEGIRREVILPSSLKLYRRERTTYKTREGHLLVVGGSAGKTGAVAMACRSATRAGAGLVSAGVPEDLNSVLETLLLEEMTLPLKGRGKLSYFAVKEILELQERHSALLLGPGMGRYEEGQDLVLSLLERWEKPVVLDADGINNLADSGKLEVLRERSVPAVLTPHLGEFERLSGVPPAEASANLTEVAGEFAERWRCFLVLKGARTAVATPEGRVYLSLRGTPAMAKGGTGDVLAGILGALVGKMEAEEALKLGVFLHGLAGELAEEKSHAESLKASEVIEALPEAYKTLEGLKEGLEPSYPLFQLL